MENVLAFIPARGGSKRLKNKNILDFNGKPLIVHTIESARNTPSIGRIVVSSDDKEILRIAQEAGAEAMERPSALSTDHSTTASAAKFTLNQLEQEGYDCRALVTLQTTNPLRPDHLIEDCIKKFFQHSEIDSLITVSENRHKLGHLENGYFVSNFYNFGQRSQDLQKMYFENGLVYVTRPELIKNEEIHGKKIFGYVVDGFWGEIDIDEKVDFEIAEFLHGKYSKHI